MCFSATASFTVAAGLAIVGGATLARRPPARILPFAVVPLIFAVHQSIEGFIWLAVNDGREPSPLLRDLWLFIAKAFWPTYAPLIVLIMERGRRRWAQSALLAAGLFVSGALLWVLLTHQYTVEVENRHLRYVAHHIYDATLSGPYLIVTVAPFLLSRARFVELFGVAVLAGAIVTQIAFARAGASVWCFFAAIASVLVYLHVRESTSRIASRRTKG